MGGGAHPRVAMGGLDQAPLFVLAYLTANTPQALVFFCGGMFAASLVGGLQAAMVQSVARNRMCGMMAALYGATVMGLGLAPTFTTAMSDHVFGGPAGLGKALAVTTVISLGACTVLLIGLPAARRRVVALRDGAPD